MVESGSHNNHTHITFNEYRLDHWEVSMERVRILYNCQLGSGAFGTVFKGCLHYDDSQDVQKYVVVVDRARGVRRHLPRVHFLTVAKQCLLWSRARSS